MWKQQLIRGKTVSRFFKTNDPINFNLLRDCNDRTYAEFIRTASICICSSPHLSNYVFAHRKEKNQKNEFRAFVSLLKRSNLLPSEITPTRRFHTSKLNYQFDKKPSSDDKSSKNKEENKNKDDDDDNKNSLLAKAVIWTVAAYLFISLLSLFPSSNQPENLHFVSWNEFLHQMLAKGEVEQIIVRPEINLVTIHLHEGAVIKGKRVSNKTFHMMIVDVQSFESKLREAEESLGIKPDKAVPVIYERNQDSSWLLLISLIVVSLMIFMMFRSGQIKTPSSMDNFFVSLKI